MPHITLEYSDNLPALENFSILFADVHRILNEQGGIALFNCKSRARAVTDYMIGDGHPDNAFVDLHIEFLSGRSEELKAALSQSCLEVLMTHYAHLINDRLQLTAGIYDIPRESYAKYPGDTLKY